MSEADQAYVRIQLTQGKFAIIDSFNLDKVNQYQWSVHSSTNGFYAVGRVHVDGVMRLVRMHRWLMGNDSPLFVDHADGDTLNNTIKNLRFATPQQNVQNRRACKKNPTQVKGVRWDDRRNVWVASIRHNKKGQFIGHFDSLEEAASAYRLKELEIFGSFATRPRQFPTSDHLPIAPKIGRKVAKSGLRGTYKHGDKWVGFMTIKGKGIYLGTFDTAEEAHEAWKAKKAVQHQ